MTRRPERLRSYEAVVAAADGDPYARWTLPPGEPVQAAAMDGAVMWTVQREHYSDTTWASLLGPIDAVVALTEAVLADPGAAGFDPAPRGISVPHGAMPLLSEGHRPAEYGDWVWWWTSEPPPAGRDEPVVEELNGSDPEARDELAAFLLEANPGASTAADDPRVRTWGVVRERGLIVASGADRPYDHGVPHLASIATRPDQRGRGLGRAVTGWLTRRRLIDDEAAVVTLGMYADNAPARALYERLGFHPEHRFTSGTLPTPTEARGSPR